VSYEGDYKQGMRDGRGKFSCKDEWVYEGDFINNNFEGWIFIMYIFSKVKENISGMMEENMPEAG
jgi:serine protease inhibitor ecotin